MTHLDEFRLIWIIFDHIRQTILDRFEIFWKKFEHFGTVVWNQYGPLWSIFGFVSVAQGKKSNKLKVRGCEYL